VSIFSLVALTGCGDFFAQKPTELETQTLLNDLKQIKENKAVTNPLPDLYRQEPQRIAVKDGTKLFYFTKHHAVEKLSGLVVSQLGYKVDTSVPTNQLIIHCPNDAQADKVLEFLEQVDVPPIQVNIDCLVVERFADVTMDWETTIKIENFLGGEITLGGKTDADGKLLPAFPGASLREPKRSEFGLDVGFWGNKGVVGHEFRAVVDMLISRGYLKVMMNPTLEILNGRTAKVLAKDYVPLEMIVSKAGFDEPFSLTEYKWVEDRLLVTPTVYADGSIGLDVHVTLGSKSKPEGVVQTSIITQRSIDVNEVRIEPGLSLVIGGLRKSEQRAVVRGVPFFKDIPLIGILFSSKDIEEKATEIIFILTPSISSGGIEYTEMIKKIREKLSPPKHKPGLGDVLTDPFGSGAYTEHVEQKAAEAEFERFKSELESAEAKEEVGQMKDKLLETAEDVLAEKQRTAEAKRAVLKMKAEAEKLKAEAEKLKAEAVQVKAEADKARLAAEKAKAEAEKAKAEEAKKGSDNQPKNQQNKSEDKNIDNDPNK